MKILQPTFSNPLITDPRHQLNESHLYLFFKDMPAEKASELLSLSWDEAFQLAAESEAVLKTLPTHDAAFSAFSQNTHQLLKLAEMLEIRQKYLHQITE